MQQTQNIKIKTIKNLNFWEGIKGAMRLKNRDPSPQKTHVELLLNEHTNFQLSKSI